MFATSSSSVLGVASNQASRISSSSASLVERSDSASTFASFHLRAPRAVSASAHNAARTPLTLLAAIDAPVPVQQQTTPWAARPSATSRAAASLAQAQSSRSESFSAPWTTGSCPRRRSSSTTASARPVRSSAATAIRMGASMPAAGDIVASVSAAPGETEIMKVGRHLAAALPGSARHPMKVLDERAMELASQDAELRAALFRFVDVVTASSDLDDLARYLTGVRDEVDDR